MSDQGRADQELVDKLDAVWRSIDELCSTLSEDEWTRPTDCPGWSVQDNLSHLGGNEAMLFLGRAAPDHELPADLPHIRNETGRINEVQVDYRRAWPGAKVLEEFREITAERLKALRSSTTEDFDKESWTPAGAGTVRDFVAIRLFDAWVHEQDMRRALGRPGDLTGPVAEHALGRIRMALGFVVGKQAAAPQGSTVVFELTGPIAATIPIAVEGRARELDEAPADPTVRITTDFETFSAVGCGRWDPSRTLDDGLVRVDGDEALGRRIVESMNFMR